MAITDPGAIQFSDQHVRPTADRLGRSYYKAKRLVTDWNAAAGTNAQKWPIFQSQIVDVCQYIGDAYFSIYRTQQMWTALGMNSLFTNSSAELVFDNGAITAQDPARPLINGQDVQRLNNRWREWLAWLEKNAFDPNSANTTDWANLQKFLKLTGDGAKAPTQGMGVAVITLCTALITQYEITVPANRDHILTVAVNP